MASTLEMFVAGIALMVNTIAILALYFIGDVILAPIVKWAEETNVTQTSAIVPIGDMTYIFPGIWGLLLIMEIICIISFAVVIGRRTQYDDYY